MTPESSPPNSAAVPPRHEGAVGECDSSCVCGSLPRREFLSLGLGAAVATILDGAAVAGPFSAEEFDKLVPADKKLHPDWIASLFARGSRTTYRGGELE